MNIFNDLFKSLALPSLLIGLTASGLAPLFPNLFKWIGLSSFLLLITYLTYIFVLIAFNKLIPRRFANSVFCLDSCNNLALILHPHYKRYQPPGSRLGYHEAPHDAVQRVMYEELGLKPESYILVSNEEKLLKFGNNHLVPKPYIVKTETGKHRLGIVEHYDYVYVCLVEGIKTPINSSLSPTWFSLEDVYKLSIDDIEKAPWGDVIPIFKRIVSEIDKLKQFDNIQMS